MPPIPLTAGPAREFRGGVGFNWFDFLGMGGSYAHPPSYYPLDAPCYPAEEDHAAWAALLAELDRLRPSFLRFGLPPDPHLGPDGRLVTDTVHLARLTRVARWAERAGCVILLDTFLLPRAHEMPPPPGIVFDGMWQMAAADNRAYARDFVAPLLSHIVRDLGLAAVRWFNPVNEPMSYGVYQTPADGPDVFAHYVDMYRELRAALDAAGLPRERVGLVGCDAVEPHGFPVMEMHARGLDIDPFVDAYSLHYYRLRFDHLPARPDTCETSPLEDAVDRHTAKLAEYCRVRGKPLWSPEIGTFYYGWRRGDPAGPTTVEACLTVAEGVVRALNAGVDAFAFWCLLNPNTIDGHWRVIGVGADGRVERAPYPYATYGALCRVLRPGERVRPLRTGLAAPAHVHGCLVGEAGGLLVNDHPDEARAVRPPALEAEAARSSVAVLIAPGRPGGTIPWAELSTADGAWLLPPTSLLAWAPAGA